MEVVTKGIKVDSRSSVDAYAQNSGSGRVESGRGASAGSQTRTNDKEDIERRVVRSRSIHVMLHIRFESQDFVSLLEHGRGAGYRIPGLHAVQVALAIRLTLQRPE
jgi:hypothetical protein